MDIESGIRLVSGRNSRGSAEYDQVCSRVTRSGTNALHQVDTLRSVSGGANTTVAASVAEIIMDAGPKRVSPLSAFQINETKEGGMMVITTKRVTQMHDIMKTLQDGPGSDEEILRSEGPWLGEELE